MADPTRGCAVVGSALGAERDELIRQGTSLGALFDGVPDAIVNRVIDDSVLVTFQADDMLIKEGHASRSIWWLLDGWADVTIGGEDTATRTSATSPGRSPC